MGGEVRVSVGGGKVDERRRKKKRIYPPRLTSIIIHISKFFITINYNSQKTEYYIQVIIITCLGILTSVFTRYKVP